jgi:hypothetical protein
MAVRRILPAGLYSGIFTLWKDSPKGDEALLKAVKNG